MVGISNRSPIEGGERDLRLKRDAVSNMGASLSRLQPRGHTFREKNVHGGTHYRQPPREQRWEESYSGVLSLSPIQPGHLPKGALDGHYGACGFIQVGGGVHQEIPSGTRMEYSRADEALTSN